MSQYYGGRFNTKLPIKETSFMNVCIVHGLYSFKTVIQVQNYYTFTTMKAVSSPKEQLELYGAIFSVHR